MAEKKEKVYVLTGKKSVQVGEDIYKGPQAEISAAKYNKLPKRVKEFFSLKQQLHFP